MMRKIGTEYAAFSMTDTHRVRASSSPAIDQRDKQAEQTVPAARAIMMCRS
jgi:hypothetical protein